MRMSSLGSIDGFDHVRKVNNQNKTTQQQQQQVKAVK